MSYKATKKQALAHKAFMVDGFKRGILLQGRQSGKTFFAMNHAWISAVLNQGRYFIVFKTYKQAHEVAWRQYVPLIPKELIFKTNESDLLIELNYIENTPVKLPSGETIMVNHDPTKPRSTIQLLGSDQADSHRGFRAEGMIFDEYADQDPNNWDAVYEPMFTTTNGWAIFMGTPRGYNHFWEMIELRKEDPTWYYQEATWRDSPYVSAEHMERAKRDAEKKGALSAFMQEYELEFRAVMGAVYPVFSREIHLIKPADVPLELTYYAAIDFGWHTTAFLLLGVDKDQTWYLIDEVYGKEETLEQVIPRIDAVIGDKRIVLMVADSANRDAVEIMGQKYPVAGVNKANDAKGYATGIGLVTEKLQPRVQLVGNPKPSLYVGSNCKHFIFEIESYHFPEEKAERNDSDIPVKVDDHGCFTADTVVNGRRIGDFGQYMGKQKVWEWEIAGTKLKATKDHPLLTQRGLVRLDTLRYNDVICKNKLFMTVSNGTSVLTALSGLIGCTISAQKRQIQALVRDCTDISGERRTARSPLAIIYITLMATLRIMTYPIYNVLVLLNTLRYILQTKVARIGDARTLLMRLLERLNGQRHQKGRKGVAKSAKRTLSTFQDTKLKEAVMYAGKSTYLNTHRGNFATKTVKPLRYVGVAKTYNQRTKTGLYTANGITVSNCDAIRYLFLHLKFGVVQEDKPLTFEMDSLTNSYGLL